MKQDFGRLIEEAIKLELNISDLYLVFYRKHPEDAEFWWQLSIEEQNHAALLKTVRQMSSVSLHVPEDIIPSDLNLLIDSNTKLTDAIGEFEEHPDRIRAFQFAFEVEHSAGELHYESFMKYAKVSRLTEVFRKLNGEDINHAQRINQYMMDHKIPHKED